MTGERYDLGYGHFAYFTSWSPDRELNLQYEGIPDVEHWGLIVDHPDARDPRKPCSGMITFDGEVQRRLAPDRPKWQVISLDPATLEVSPSLLCKSTDDPAIGCGDHGFIRNGRWVPA